MKSFILIILSLLVASCASDYYTMNKFRNVKLPSVVGYRANNPMSVSLITDDALLIEENSKTSLRKFDVTQYAKSFILKKKSGNDLIITGRTSPLDLDTTKGIKLVFSEIGINIFENEKLIGSKPNYRIQKDLEYIFRIIQDGDYYTTIIDCDTIIKFKSNIPATEYTEFATGNDTEIELYSFDVQELYENPDF